MPGFALTLAPMIAVFYAPPEQAKADVTKWSLVFFGIGLGCLAAATVRQAGLGRAGSRLTRRLREQLLEAALRQEIAWFDAPENASGALAARLSADAAHVRGAAGDALGVAAQAATGLGGGLAIAFASGWRLALVILSAIPLLVASAWVQGAFLAGTLSKGGAGGGDGDGGGGGGGGGGRGSKKTRERGGEGAPPPPRRDAAALAQQIASEALAAPRAVAALGLDVPLAGAYDALLAGPARRAAARGQVAGVSFGLSQFVLFAVYALAFYYGGRLVSEGRMSFEAMLRVFFGELDLFSFFSPFSRARARASERASERVDREKRRSKKRRLAFLILFLQKKKKKNAAIMHSAVGFSQVSWKRESQRETERERGRDRLRGKKNSDQKTPTKEKHLQKLDRPRWPSLTSPRPAGPRGALRRCWKGSRQSTETRPGSSSGRERF